MKRFFNRALGRLAMLAMLAMVTSGLAAMATAYAATPPEIRVDYAYYSPESLVIKRYGWLEDEFKPDHAQIKWVLSLGSNRALEYLNSGAIDIGSTAGLAAVLGKANGNPIRTPYIFFSPDWAAPGLPA